MKKSSAPFERKRQRLTAGSKPRVLDICGGAGGFSLGFMKAGFELLGAVENDPVAAATYAANLHAHRVQAAARAAGEAARSSVHDARQTCNGARSRRCR